MAAAGRSFFSRFSRLFPAQSGLAAAARRALSRDDLEDLAVSQLVHDLRNQLTVMVGRIDDLGALVPRGYADQQITELRRAAERSSALVRDLLIAAQPGHPERRRIDLNGAINRAKPMLTAVTRGRVRLEMRLGSEPLYVIAEAAEIERILLNLVLNSRDALAGEGVIFIETMRDDNSSSARVEARPRARLMVSDSGSGMTPHVRQQAFTPFFTTKSTGTGLGLSSVAHTVRALEGSVWIDTAFGRGTSVFVVLPLTE